MSSVEPSSFCVIYSTFPDLLTAKKLAREVVTRKLAACINLLSNVTSIYSWQGEISEDEEVLVVIKTRQDLVKELEKEVKAHHPYEVPEFLCLPIVDGCQDYLDWMAQVT